MSGAGKSVRIPDAAARCRALEREVIALREALAARTAECDDLRVFFANAADGILIGDAAGTLIGANPFICTLLGYQAGELLGRHIRVLFPPDVLEAKPLRFDLLSQNQVLTNTRDMVTRDGIRVPIEMRSLRLPDGRHLAFVRDESERQSTSRALQLAQAESRRQVAFLTALVEAIPSPVFWKDRDGRYQDCNQAFSDLTGVAAEQLRGRTVQELWPSELAEAYHRRDLELIATGGRQAYEWKMRDRYGNDREVVYSKGVYRNETGAVAGLVGSFVDISALKRVEATLRETTREMEALIANVPGTVFRADLAFPWRFIRVSPSIGKLIGRPVADHRADMPALGGILLAEDQEGVRRMVAEAVAAGASFQAEGRIRAADGTLRYVQIIGQAVGGEADRPKFIDGIILDITGHRLLEDRLRQSEKLTAIGQLAGGIAHDFNNQLTGILGLADLMLHRLREPELRNYAETIVAAATRAADLTRKLLAFARKGAFQQAPVDMHRMINEVAELLIHSIDKRIRIHRRLDAVRCQVLGDASQLQSALLNLGLNARDAMPMGGELVLATGIVELDAAMAQAMILAPPAGRYLQVSVRDSGVGMADEVIGHLFEPFFTTKGIGKGTGMGLASVYGTVDSHHGGIALRSDPGKGTEFSIYLPLHDGSVSELAGESPPEAPFVGRRVLVVDDEEAVRTTISQILSVAGFAVTECADAMVACNHLAPGSPEVDLVILDLIMPRLSGYEVFRRMRELRPGVRVLVCTGFKDEHGNQAVISAPRAGFLAKPFRGRDLLAAVRQLLNQPAEPSSR